jgi:hypothetical protein
MGHRRGAYKVLVVRTEKTKPLGRPKRKLKDNIKINFKKWNREAKDRDSCPALVNAVMNLLVP